MRHRSSGSIPMLGNSTSSRTGISRKLSGWQTLGRRLKVSLKVVPLAEIEKNDFSLNVTLYVSPQKVVEEVDIPATWAAIKDVEKELLVVDDQIPRVLQRDRVQGEEADD